MARDGKEIAPRAHIASCCGALRQQIALSDLSRTGLPATVGETRVGMALWLPTGPLFSFFEGRRFPYALNYYVRV